MADVKPRVKPAKPYASFPLTPHNSGKWAKKVRGKVYYFGRWDDPDAALAQFNAVKAALFAGQVPNLARPDLITVRQAFIEYLRHQQAKVDAARLKPRTYADARGHLQEFAEKVGPTRSVAGLTPLDFSAARESFASHYGPHALNRAISNVMGAFRFTHKNGMAPMPSAGSMFAKESARAQRRVAREATYSRGKKLFTPGDCRKLVNAAGVQLKAMILLGLNCGFLAADVAELPIGAVDLDAGWLDYARPKTEVQRRAPLWPETVKAIRAAIRSRPRANRPTDASLIFITAHGNRWVQDTVHRGERGIEKVTRTDAVNGAFKRLLDQLKIRRPGINFSALRSTFRTAADDTGDQHAVHLMMGHNFPGMSAVYVRDLKPERLKRVAGHVHRVLLHSKQVRPVARQKPANRRRGKRR